MGCKHRAGFTYGISRLKPRASEKMGDLITNNEDLFFSSPVPSEENRTSEDGILQSLGTISIVLFY